MACILLHIFCITFCLPFLAVCQSSTGIVNVSASQTATENPTPWLSPSGDFAFGFRQLQGEDLFLVAIWYDKVPDKTIVWYANGDNPAPRGSRLELTADRGLVLTDPQNQDTLVSDPIIGSVAYGVMNDTGNFLLSSRSSERLWESYNHATDTILPSQMFNTSGQVLFSRLTETNFSRGRFQLNLNSTGNLELCTVNLPGVYLNEPYYSRGLNSSPSNYQLVFNQSASLYVSNSEGQRFIFSQDEANTASSFYHRATLSSNGVFAHYRLPKNSSGNGSWHVVWSVPNNICVDSVVSAGSGVCGYNRICRLNIDRTPSCECPRAFSLVDPKDEYRGCKPDFVQGCEDGSILAQNLYDFDRFTDIDWPTSDYELLQPYDEEKCKVACLNDCMCAVAISSQNGQCWKKKLPLSNGRVDSNLNKVALIKRRKTNSPPDGSGSPTRGRKNQDTVVLLVSVFLGSSVFANFILLSVIFLGFFLIYNKKLTKNRRGESSMERNLRSFTYKELVDATKGFTEELGRGSFGSVYKGVVEMSCSKTVAVKKLDRFIQDGEQEFKTEVNVIGQTHHRNLVQLVGFCDEGSHRLLVYEFLSNGSLAGFLFGDLKLSWNQRTQIACGIARGLLYLHDECSNQIIHCDVKPQNILLDDSYNARISDFGLAKLLMMDKSETYTAIRGTKGYVAPEWFRNMPITVKADVYSFGILLLEIICCRRNVDMEIGGDEAILTYWAYDCYLEGRIDVLVENDTDATSDSKKLQRFVMVAIWCVQEDPYLRPQMKNVVLMLEGILEVTAPPCPFPLSTIQRN